MGVLAHFDLRNRWVVQSVLHSQHVRYSEGMALAGEISADNRVVALQRGSELRPCCVHSRAPTAQPPLCRDLPDYGERNKRCRQPTTETHHSSGQCCKSDSISSGSTSLGAVMPKERRKRANPPIQTGNSSQLLTSTPRQQKCW
jgi:hypothetical protein